MQIIRFEIDGLLGRSQRTEMSVSSDLGLLTGRNGAGKTSILKLLWAIVSGNIMVALDEVNFQRAHIVTSDYECTLHRLGRRTCKVEITIEGKTTLYEDLADEDDDIVINAEDEANSVLRAIGSSVFFPTFRRIEGGFTISTSRNLNNSLQRQFRAKNELEDAMLTLSRTLTHNTHVFVSSISTADIVALLLRQYADFSEIANILQADTSQKIIQRIKNLNLRGDEAERLESATGVLEEVRSSIEQMEISRQDIMAPMDEVRELVERLFQNTGIRFGPRLSFGDAANAINSDVLSAGEKQMLSFVCYNAFYKDSIIFIDEPELSLHVDWQRQLFSILHRQQSTNQFIVATHSPFIYTKYQDKELSILGDRGDDVEHDS